MVFFLVFTGHLLAFLIFSVVFFVFFFVAVVVVAVVVVVFVVAADFGILPFVLGFVAPTIFVPAVRFDVAFLGSTETPEAVGVFGFLVLPFVFFLLFFLAEYALGGGPRFLRRGVGLSAMTVLACASNSANARWACSSEAFPSRTFFPIMVTILVRQFKLSLSIPCTNPPARLRATVDMLRVDCNSA